MRYRAGGRGRRQARADNRRGRAALDEAEDILLGHAAGESRTRNRRNVDAVVRRDLPHERRGAAAQTLLGSLDPPVPLPRRRGGGRSGSVGGSRSGRRGGLRRGWSRGRGGRGAPRGGRQVGRAAGRGRGENSGGGGL